MTKVESSHHCWKCQRDGKGGSKKSRNGGVCREHQNWCNNGHPEEVFDKGQQCPGCQEKHRREERRRRKAQEAADKAAKKKSEDDWYKGR